MHTVAKEFMFGGRSRSALIGPLLGKGMRILIVISVVFSAVQYWAI